MRVLPALIQRDEVFVVRHPVAGRRATFYRNMTPEMPVLLCSGCDAFAHEEDFQFHALQKLRCPGQCAGKTCVAFDWETLNAESLEWEDVC